jgi:hypothetical protein
VADRAAGAEHREGDLGRAVLPVAVGVDDIQAIELVVQELIALAEPSVHTDVIDRLTLKEVQERSKLPHDPSEWRAAPDLDRPVTGE